MVAPSTVIFPLPPVWVPGDCREVNELAGTLSIGTRSISCRCGANLLLMALFACRIDGVRLFLNLVKQEAKVRDKKFQGSRKLQQFWSADDMLSFWNYFCYAKASGHNILLLVCVNV